MVNVNNKDFNAMLNDNKDFPKIKIINDSYSIKKYGGNRMYMAEPLAYDSLMRKIPRGKITTIAQIRNHLASANDCDFCDPFTAGIFISISAWASFQRKKDETPYWRTLKSNGELNEKYPGGIKAQKEKLEEEGFTIIKKGKINIRYCVKDYERYLFKF